MIKNIRIDEIKESTINPRILFTKVEELKEDFKKRLEEGQIPVIENIGVREIEDPEYKYEIIWGMQRFKAAKEVGLETVPCIVEKDIDPYEAMILALKENRLSDPNNWYEEAVIYERLQERYSIREIAKLVGDSRSNVFSKITSKKLIDFLSCGRTLEERVQIAMKYPFTVWEQLSQFSEEEIPMLLEKLESGEINREDLRSILRNKKKMKDFFETLDKNDPLYKELYDFWWDKRLHKNSYQDMMEEVSIREGSPNMIYEYKPTSSWTEEQAREYAKSRHGEYQGKAEFHIIFCSRKTIEEIRGKYT